MDVDGDGDFEGKERDGSAAIINMEVELIVPVALENGSQFAIREGGLTVGAGVIFKDYCVRKIFRKEAWLSQLLRQP